MVAPSTLIAFLQNAGANIYWRIKYVLRVFGDVKGAYLRRICRRSPPSSVARGASRGDIMK